MQNKKLIAIPMLLAFALVTIGFAYAHWSENLYINGTVNTGELDWEFTGTHCLDTGVCNDYHCRDGFVGTPQFWQGDKDVGSSSVSFDPSIDPHTITLVLDNVYPCYFTSVSVYAKNTGTIPLIFQKAIVKSDYETIEITKDDQIVNIDLNGDHLSDIEIYWGDHIGKQVHPGYPVGEVSFWIHVLQDTPQGKTLQFTISMVAINWNEYVSPP